MTFDLVKHRKEMKNVKRQRQLAMFGIFILLIAFVSCIAALFKFSNKQTQRHTIQSIDKVENTTGSADGFSTKVYYIVTTDKGVYHIETSGFNAHPECAAIKKDSTYVLVTRGFNFPFLGMYSSIISYHNITE